MSIRQSSFFSESLKRISQITLYFAQKQRNSPVKSNTIDKQLESWQKYLTANSLFILLLEFHILIVSLIHNEMVYENELLKYELLLLIFILVLSGMLVLTIILGHQIENKIIGVLDRLYPNTKYPQKTPFFLALKLSTCFIIPNPFFKMFNFEKFSMYSEIFHINYDYYYNDIMTVFMVVKFLTLLPAFLNLSYLSQYSFQRIIVNNNIKNRYLFIVKFYMQKFSLQVSLTLLLVMIFLFTFIIRILERPNPYHDFENFFHSFYFTTVTITTIGYGDYTPKTPIGRIFTLVLMIFGIVNVNLVNYSMIQYLDFNQNENKAHNLSNLIESVDTIKKDYLDFFYYFNRITNLLEFQSSFKYRYLGQVYFRKMLNCYENIQNKLQDYQILKAPNIDLQTLKKYMRLNYQTINQQIENIQKQNYKLLEHIQYVEQKFKYKMDKQHLSVPNQIKQFQRKLFVFLIQSLQYFNEQDVFFKNIIYIAYIDQCSITI